MDIAMRCSHHDQSLTRVMQHPWQLSLVSLPYLDSLVTMLASVTCLPPGPPCLLLDMQDPAEFAKIGKYYATESMLVWDERTGRYDPDATPSYGTDTLAKFYERSVKEGLKGQELGDQAVFGVNES